MVDKTATRQRRSRLGLYGVAAILVGVLIGIVGYTVSYAEVKSYFGTEPETCTNCHVMQKEYNAWQAGSHANVATCDDCHLPHDNIAKKLFVQADDGVRHATAFTFKSYPENIQIRDSSLQVANDACLYCHGDLTSSMKIAMGADENKSCVHCHSGVGHEVKGK